MFGRRRSSARQAYRSFVEKGIEQGRRPELSGGGLIRSAGDFVNRVLAETREALEKRHALRAEGIDLDNIAFRVSELMGVKPEDVWAKGKYPRIVDARGLFCYWAVRENVRAQMRVIIKRILRKYGYPPDRQARATELVLEQAEVLCNDWAEKND